MSNNIFKRFLSIILLFVTSVAFAQEEVEMADQMRSEGKIYVVVAILSLILTGLLLYVFVTDRKITRLEKKITEKKN
jgi:uncharacterized integral membrane protein